MKEQHQRLYSLDLLRGADIFLLTVICGIVGSLDNIFSFPDWFMDQFEHPAWVGFSFHDLIMPLFIFMCGAALPLALPRRLDADGKAGWPYWRHVFARVALLWFFGMISQGEIFSFDLKRISFFNNTLQTIACGYIAVAIVSLIRSAWVRALVPFVLAAGYTAFLHLCGDMTPTGNAAVVYEVKFLSLFYPDPAWHPVRQIAAWHYTWWTTVPMFAVMGLAGYHATSILRQAWSNAKRLGVMVAVGLGLGALGAGLIFAGDDCIKHIFTASFTSLAMGCGFLFYALFFFLFDVLNWRRGTWILNLFGRHSLWAYMMADTTFRAILWVGSAIVLCGVHRKVGDGLSRFMDKPTFTLVQTLVIDVLLVLSMWAWDEWKRRGRALAKAGAASDAPGGNAAAPSAPQPSVASAVAAANTPAGYQPRLPQNEAKSAAPSRVLRPKALSKES